MITTGDQSIGVLLQSIGGGGGAGGSVTTLGDATGNATYSASATFGMGGKGGGGSSSGDISLVTNPGKTLRILTSGNAATCM